MRISETVGNIELIKREKSLFICSKRTPIELYEKVFKWVDEQSKRDCIVCFNTTEMEKEVLKALLVNGVPTILVVVNKHNEDHNVQVERALRENRLLILILKRDEPKDKGNTSRLRNEFVLSKVQNVVCGYINKNGSIFPLLAGRNGVKYLIDDDVLNNTIDKEIVQNHWRVDDDKLLLRMYYEDMGIHAMQKQLKYSYSSINQRIRSITLTEDVLKGREFEDCILGLFDLCENSDFRLMEWQGDKKLGDICPEGNHNPDLVLCYKQSTYIAVECKWREKLKIDIENDMFSENKISAYQKFAAERNIPVFIVLGVGGTPSEPKLLYVIPLQDVPAIVNKSKSIVLFLRSSTESSFCINEFLPKEMVFPKRYTMKEIREVYPNAYCPWKKEDDERLISLFKLGKSVNELSVIFQRNNGAISSRLRKLGLKE